MMNIFHYDSSSSDGVEEFKLKRSKYWNFYNSETLCDDNPTLLIFKFNWTDGYIFAHGITSMLWRHVYKFIAIS